RGGISTTPAMRPMCSGNNGGRSTSIRHLIEVFGTYTATHFECPVFHVSTTSSFQSLRAGPLSRKLILRRFSIPYLAVHRDTATSRDIWQSYSKRRVVDVAT